MQNNNFLGSKAESYRNTYKKNKVRHLKGNSTKYKINIARSSEGAGLKTLRASPAQHRRGLNLVLCKAAFYTRVNWMEVPFKCICIG